MKTCPICYKEIGKDDELIATYCKEQDWWMISHLKKGFVDDNPYPFQMFNPPLESMEYRESCCLAGFKFKNE